MKIEKSSLKECKFLLQYHYLQNRPPYIKRVFKAVINKKIVACIITKYSSLQMKPRPFNTKKVECVTRIIIHPDYRSIGIGSLLLRHVLRTSKEKIIECITERMDLERFFLKNGMKTCIYNAKNGLRLYASYINKK